MPLSNAQRLDARNAHTPTLFLCCSHVYRHLHLEGLEGEDALDAGRLLPAGVRGGGGCDEQGEGPRREALVEEALRAHNRDVRPRRVS